MEPEPSPRYGDITAILRRLNAGHDEAWHDLVPLAYKHLKQVAAAYLRREQNMRPLQPTEIVHETYLRLLRLHSIEWVNRNHFYGVAAHLIRLILVDKARSAARQTKFRKNAQQNTRIECESKVVDVESLHAALDRLAQLDPRQAHIVELRYFAGMTIEETAEVLSIAPRTVKREWTSARAWLHGELDR